VNVVGQVLVNKRALNAFGRAECGCVLCKHTACGADPEYIARRGQDKVLLCWSCAKVYDGAGWDVYEMIF